MLMEDSLHGDATMWASDKHWKPLIKTKQMGTKFSVCLRSIPSWFHGESLITVPTYYSHTDQMSFMLYLHQPGIMGTNKAQVLLYIEAFSVLSA